MQPEKLNLLFKLMSDVLPSLKNRPHGVSSQASGSRRVAPVSFPGDPGSAWETWTKLVFELPRTQVVAVNEHYLHAVFRSRVFGFQDDLKCLLNPENRTIDVYSAARSGYWDLGVNRRRVETLRQTFKASQKT